MIDDDVRAASPLQGALVLAAGHVFPEADVANDDVAFLADRTAKAGHGYAGTRGRRAVNGCVAVDRTFRFELDDAGNLEDHVMAARPDGVAKRSRTRVVKIGHGVRSGTAGGVCAKALRAGKGRGRCLGCGEEA